MAHAIPLPWQHTAVRDLDWALRSPPLLTAPSRDIRWLDSAWSRQVHAESRDWLAALDRDHSPLLAALATRRDPRLGSYFEGLLAFWLAWPGNPRYRLVGRNLAVREGRRTLGELDFLVQDRESGELQHWEVAVKFYLGTAPGGAHANWQGPGLKDRLDLKVGHLTGQQLRLGEHPEARRLLRQMGLPDHPPRPVCLLKGRLFYPPGASPADWAPRDAAPDHLQGWWMPWDAFLTRYADNPLHWQPLPREHWLTPVTGGVKTNGDAVVPIGDALPALPFIETLQRSADNRAAAVIGLAPATGEEVTRGFVTPPGWPGL